MKISGSKYTSNVAMLDLLFLLLLAFALMFIILLAILKTETHQPAIVDKNQYVIKMTWNEGARVDMDMWMLLPDKSHVSFRRKEAGGSFLQRDDLGGKNDTIKKADGTVLISTLNEEIINIRIPQTGRHYINAHMYKSYESRDVIIDVMVSIIRVTPFGEFESNPVKFTAVKQEKTMVTFDLNADGSITLLPPVNFPFVTRREAQAVTNSMQNETHSISPDTVRQGGDE